MTCDVKTIRIDSEIAYVTLILHYSFPLVNTFESNEIERQYSV